MQLRFVRDLELRSSGLTAVIFLALVLAVGGFWPIVALLVVLVGSGAHIAWLTFAARRLGATGK